MATVALWMLSSSASVRVSVLSTVTAEPFSVNWAFKPGADSTGLSTVLVMLSVMLAVPVNGPPAPWSCPVPWVASPACLFWSLML